MPSLPSGPATATYEDVTGSVTDISVTEIGFQREVLGAPVFLERGDVLVIQGQLGKR